MALAGTTPPVIDISPLLAAGSAPAEAETVDLIHQACIETGFLVAVGHGIEQEMSALFEQAGAFFALPQADKEHIPRVDRYGFVPRRDWAVDTDRPSGNTEYFDMGLSDESHFPDLVGFEATVRSYQQAALGVGAALLVAVARGLGARTDFFTARMQNPQCRLRLLHYPPGAPGPDGELPVPTEPHTDYGAITLLATDGVPGLEVRPLDHGWIPVAAPAGSLVVNLGDMLARWSNDVYRSTPHRVVGPIGRDRISIPFFVNPDPATVVECIPSCVSPERPCRYEPVTAGRFLASRIDDHAEPYVDRKEGPTRRIPTNEDR